MAREADLETRYSCPKCKRKVTVLIPATVTCAHCGRPMKEQASKEHD